MPSSSRAGADAACLQAGSKVGDNLPETATWDDMAYEVELRASIERGLADAKAGRLIPVEDLMKELGVAE